MCTVLHQNYSISTTEIESLTGILNLQISPFYYGHNMVDLEAALNKIITRAFELGALMAQAKARYYPYGLQLVEDKETIDESWMEIPCAKPGKGQGINILITPALIK